MLVVARTIYGLLGAGSLVAGLATFFVQRGDDHLILEFGSSLIAVGILCLLVAIHIADSHPWRIVALVFFFLIAGLHIGEYFRGMVPPASPLMNCLPFAALLTVEIGLRRRGRAIGAKPSAG